METVTFFKTTGDRHAANRRGNSLAQRLREMANAGAPPRWSPRSRCALPNRPSSNV